jgi:hypothetical protein
MSFASCVLGACSQDRQSIPAANRAPDAGKTEARSAVTGILQLQPASLRECELQQGVGAVETVIWDASATKGSTAKIWVQASGGERKLWTAGGATGNQATGPWVFPGTVFVLTDGDDKVLAQVTAVAKPCH